MMEWKKGRLIDHVHLRVADLKRSEVFYRAIAHALNIDSFDTHEEYFTCDELFVSPTDGKTSRIHLAFQANSREAVDDFHAVAIANGGTDNGKPGERDYHPGYYAAYVFDPDGNNIEAVHHGPSRRSAAAIVFTFEPEG